MTEYKVGDKLRYVAVYGRYFTNGEIYVISRTYKFGFYVIDDAGDEHHWDYENIGVEFELVDEEIPVEASPTVIELLANISRRLYEAERKIDSQRNQIDVLNSVVSRL